MSTMKVHLDCLGHQLELLGKETSEAEGSAPWLINLCRKALLLRRLDDIVWQLEDLVLSFVAAKAGHDRPYGDDWTTYNDDDPGCRDFEAWIEEAEHGLAYARRVRRHIEFIA